MSDMPPPGAVPEKDILQKPSGVAKPGANRALTYADADTPASAPKPAGTAASAPGKKTALDLELERRKQAAEQEQSAKKKADEEHKATVQKDNCSRARSTAATFESGQRVSRMNERGEREYLDDRQRAAEAQRARDVMAANCR
jgi:hypothetical protein